MAWLRRDFVFVAAGSMAGALALAQARGPRVVGLLLPLRRADAAAIVEQLQTGLRERGWSTGRDIRLEARFAEGDYRQLPRLAADLVAAGCEVIVANASPAIRAVLEASPTVPIVAVGTGDPVGAGFAQTLARPAGRVTGLSNLNVDLSPKLLELLQQVVPRLARVALLGNPASSSHAGQKQQVDTAAKAAGVAVVHVQAQTPAEIDAAFQAMSASGAQAVVVAGDALFTSEARRIAALAIRHRLPSISQRAGYAEAGGLMSYGSSSTPEWYRHAADRVDKILRGARAGDLPFEQPTTFEFLVNLRAARELRAQVPPPLMTLATRIIE